MYITRNMVYVTNNIEVYIYMCVKPCLNTRLYDEVHADYLIVWALVPMEHPYKFSTMWL